MDFTSANNIRNEIQDAILVLNTFQVIYSQCNTVSDILARYSTDPEFKAQADYLFSPEQLVEISEMATDVLALKSRWTMNHRGPLGLDG